MITNYKKFKRLYENMSTEILPNEVRIYSCDWKSSLTPQEKEDIKRVIRATNGYAEEIDVYTGDERITVAGPVSFFDWLENNTEYGDGMEMFLDASVMYDENGDEREEVDIWYMKDNELYVKTDKGIEYSYADWYNKIMADTENTQETQEEI